MSVDANGHGLENASFPPIYRLSVAQYHQMIETGILTTDDRVELIEGWLIEKMSKNKPHGYATHRLRAIFESLIPEGWFVDSQEPVTTDDSEPEPDVSILRGSLRDYLVKDRGPSDTALIAEVADSSLSFDRGKKKTVYARAGFPVYWIVNLPDRQIEVYTQPTGPSAKPDYQQPNLFTENDTVPLVLDGVEIGQVPVKDVLP
jgi:Uma2 family endonuclease